MKISTMIGVLLVLAVVIHYVTFRSDSNAGLKPLSEMSSSRPASEEAAINMAPSAQDSASQIIDNSDQNRRNDMRAAYAKLEQARKLLKSQANLLKSKIWGLQLPAEQANNVSKKMRQVYAYLKNPPMLGAYFELDEIHIEIRKVEAMQEGLNEAEQLIAASQNSRD